MMRIVFSAIYSEVDTSFDLSHIAIKSLIKNLNGLTREIAFFKEKFKDEDFVLEFIISATRKNNSLEIKGPRVLHKAKRVQFAIWIPFKQIRDFNERTSYAFAQLASGIIWVFDKYETDSSRVDEIVQELIGQVQKNPLAYQ